MVLMMAGKRMIPLILAVGLLVQVCGEAETAEKPATPFFQGKTITLVVGYSPGGGYDRYTRVLAAHLGNHIPGKPTVITENRPGAGSRVAVGYLYNVAAKDGTVLGLVPPSMSLQQLVGAPGVDFDMTRFAWIGSMNKEVEVLIGRSGTGVDSFDQTFNTPMTVGATGPGSTSFDYPMFANQILGSKLNIVRGFSGASDIYLAIERGDVSGLTSTWTALKSGKKDWLDSGYVKLLVQFATDKHPDLQNVPTIVEFAKDEGSRRLNSAMFAGDAMGRAFAAPPGVPSDRAKILRDAFMATMKDPAFLKRAQEGRIEIAPLSGSEVEEIVKNILGTPSNLAQRLKPIIIGAK
jgi:tripartite-type tricarboxylate transporter receptor subunit TctC